MTIDHPASQPAHHPHAQPGPAAYQQVTDQQRAHWRRIGTRRIVFGALWLLAGVLITLITMSHAAAGGGFYVIAFGPVIGGIVQMISGARSYQRGAA